MALDNITLADGSAGFKAATTDATTGETVTQKLKLNATTGGLDVVEQELISDDGKKFKVVYEDVVVSSVVTGVKETIVEEYVTTGSDGADVTMLREAVLVKDLNGVIQSGTEKSGEKAADGSIDGPELTIGLNGAVTATQMDAGKLGTALSGTALAAVTDTYNAVDGSALADDATIYMKEEPVAGGVKLKTLFDANGVIVGTEDTSTQVWDGVTYTTTNHMDADGEYIGNSGGDGTNSWSFFEVKSTNSDNVEIITETGSDTYGGETRTFTYVFNAATRDLISGTEVFDGITTTYGANWAIAGESIDLSGLTDTMTAEQVENTPDAIVTKFSLTTDTLVKKEAFDFYGEGTVAEEYTVFDTNGVTLGYANLWADDYGSNVSFHDANDVYLGNYWSDAEGRSGESAIVTNTNGTVTESGKYSDGVDGGESSSYEWNFDAAGNMTSGEEVRGSTTYTYGANWVLTGTEADLTGLTALNLDAIVPGNSALNDLVKDAFFTTGQTYYTTLEEFSWGGSLVTYLNADGSIKGYADTYSDDWNGDGTVDSSGTTYMDHNWNYVGSAWSDSYGSGQQFVTNKAVDGTVLSEGQREFGVHTWKDQDGNEETREFDYIYDANWNLVSGVETSSDGVETTYGQNWEILGQKADVSGLGSALSDSELAGVPTSIQSSLADGNTYASSQTYDWGTDTTYYDSAGKILGYSNSSEWSYGDEQGSNKGFHDAEWNWLGGSWEDKDADGTVIRSGYNSTTDILTAGAVTGYVDKGGFTEGDFSETYEWTFDLSGNMLSGTETRGTTTFTYGANWTLEGSEADTSSLATLDLSTLPDSVVTVLFGSDTAVIKFSEETFAWDASSTQTTYYDANGAIVGYKDDWSDDWNNDGTADATGSSYMDENWEHIGSSWDDEWGSGFNFTVRTYVNDANGDPTDVVSEINEVGEHSWVGYDGTTETREFAFKYDGNWDLISGTEKSSNGETVTFGEDWEVISVARAIDLTSTALAELSVADLNGIPTALHAEGTTYDATTGLATGFATGQVTYAETVVHPWGTQKTYLDSAGQILGYSDAWSDDWDDDQIIDSKGTSFQDADWNHLGSTFEDNWSKGFQHTVEILNADGDVTGYKETGSRTDKAAGDDYGEYTGETTATSFIFNTNWELMSGTETRGSTTTVFKEGWVIDEAASFTDTSSIPSIDVSGLPASVKALLFTGEILTVANPTSNVKAETTVFDWGGSQTVYFDGAGNVLGYSDTYSDDMDGDGNAEYSGVSYMDAEWNHIGGSYSNDYDDDGTADESGSNFTVVDDVAGTITESGSSSWDGGTETRSFTFVYNMNYELQSGVETSSNGTTTTYGLNWVVEGSSIDTSKLGTALGANDLAGLPAQLKASGDTFSKIEPHQDGAYTTYYDSLGNILGFHDSWSFPGGSGSSYFDANNNHLGGSHSDAYGSFSTIMTDNGDGTFTENGIETRKDPDGNVEGRKFVFELDANMEITSGSEIEARDTDDNGSISDAEWAAGKTITFGAKGAFQGEKVSLTGATTMHVDDLAKLPSAFTAATGATLYVDNVEENGPQFFFTIRTFVDENQNVLGTQEIYSNDYVSGTWSMDANGNHVGDSNSDDVSSMSFTIRDTMSTGPNPTKTGTTETRTETYKNIDNSDGANFVTYTGDSFTTVETFDLTGTLLTTSDARTIDGETSEDSFSASGEMLGSYKFVDFGDGAVRVIEDPYELFQMKEFVVELPYLKAYANTKNIFNYANENGEFGKLSVDNDGDGGGDLSMEVARSFLNATVFGGVQTYIKDGSDNLIGLSMKAGGYDLQLFGPLATAGNPNATVAEIDQVSGTVERAYVYDVSTGELVASSESLGISFIDLGMYFMSRNANGETGNPDGSTTQSLVELFGGPVSVEEEVITGAVVVRGGDGTMSQSYESDDGSKTTEVTGTDGVTVRTVVAPDGSVKIVELEVDQYGKTQERSLGQGDRFVDDVTGMITDTVTGDNGEFQTTIYMANGAMSEVLTEADGSGSVKKKLATGENVNVEIDADTSFVEVTTSLDSDRVDRVEVVADGALLYYEVENGGSGTATLLGSGTQITTENGDIVRTVFTHDSTSGEPTAESVVTRTSPDGTITRTFTDDTGAFDYTEVETAQPDGSSLIIKTYADGHFYTKSTTILENGTVREVSADPDGHVFRIQDKEMVYDAAGLDRKHTETRFDENDNVIQVKVYSKNVMTKTETDPSTGNTRLTLMDQHTGDAVVTETNLVSGTVTVANVAKYESAAPVVVLASTGTRVVDPNTKAVTVVLDTLDASGIATGASETIVTAADGVVTTSQKDASGASTLSSNSFVENDGTQVLIETASGVTTETITNPDGTKKIFVTDGSTVTVSEMVYNTSGDLITSVIGSGTRTVDSTTNFITEEFTNSVTGKIETIVTDPSTGKEVTEISTGVGAGRVVETTTTIEPDANGLPTTKIENADGSRVELFTNAQGVTEETRIDADNKITVVEKGVNDDGSIFENIVATGTASTGTNNEEIFALTTSDNVAIVRTVLQSGAESIVATDPFGVVNTVGISATGTVTQTFEKDGAVIAGDQFSGPAGIGFDENLLVGDEEHANDGPHEQIMSSSTSASANANLSFEWTSGENLTLDEVFISYDIA